MKRIFDAPSLLAVGPVHALLITKGEEWNGILATLSGAEVEHGYEWGEVLRDTGWRPCRFAVFRGDAPIAAVAVLIRSIPGLPFSFAYAPRGPIVETDDADAWRAIDALWARLADDHRLVFVRVSAARCIDDVEWGAALARDGFDPLPMQWTTWNMPRIVLTLDLRPSAAELARRLRKQIRQSITAAERRDVAVRQARSAGEAVRFHELLVETACHRYPVRRATRMLALWREYVARGQGVVLLAEHGGQTLGGLCGVRAGRRAAFQALAIRRDPPSLDMDQGALLYWSFILWAKAAGCEVIDWGGSATRYPPSPSDQGWGLYQFKRGFGCTLEYRLPYHDRVFRPGPYRIFRVVEDRVLPWAWRWRAWFNR